MIRVLILTLFSVLSVSVLAETHQVPVDASLTKGGADTCLGCHNDPSMQVIFRTPHGQQADPESPMAQLQCESCHGPGGDHADRRQPRPGHAPVVNFGSEAASSV